MYKGTLGQALVNSTLPQGYDVGPNFVHNDVKAQLNSLAMADPDKYSVVAPEIKRLGDEISTYEGLSVGLDDIEPEYKKRDPIIRDARKQLKTAKTTSRITDILLKAQARMIKATSTHQGDMGFQARSGAKGNMIQLMKTVSSPVVVGGKKGAPVPYLVERGYGEGVSPAEAWISAQEARDLGQQAAIGTYAPGEMQKVMANVMSPLVVSDTDCGTTNGIMLDAGKENLEGRYLAGSNKYVDSKVRRTLKGKVKVRSSMTCEKEGGICQKCTGRDVLGKDYDIGSNIGIRSSQALTEPLTQMTLSSKHGVSLVKGDVNKPRGLAAFKQFVEMPKSFAYKAPVSEVSGKVEEITKAPQGGFDLKINGTPHYVPPKRDLKVKKGQTLEAGDVLSSGIPNPTDIFKHKGLGAGRAYVANSLKDVYAEAGIKADPKHFENLVRAQFNYVKPTERIGDILPGEVVPYNTAVKAFNESGRKTKLKDAHGKVLTKNTLQHVAGTQINRDMLKDFKEAKLDSVDTTSSSPKFVPEVAAATRTPLLNPNWMQRLAFRHQKRVMIQAATEGEVAQVSGYDPLPSIITGEIGRGSGGRY
jgi:DNA-directed RNA polymerase subunit beta'